MKSFLSLLIVALLPVSGVVGQVLGNDNPNLKVNPHTIELELPQYTDTMSTGRDCRSR